MKIQVLQYIMYIPRFHEVASNSMGQQLCRGPDVNDGRETASFTNLGGDILVARRFLKPSQSFLGTFAERGKQWRARSFGIIVKGFEHIEGFLARCVNDGMSG